jgi:hypothetical protein
MKLIRELKNRRAWALAGKKFAVDMSSTGQFDLGNKWTYSRTNVRQIHQQSAELRRGEDKERTSLV